MKKWIIIVGSFVLLAVGMVYYFMTDFKVVNAWSEGDDPIILPNSILSIQFSGNVSEKSVSPDLIYVRDDKGVKVDTELELSDDKRTIYIIPPEKGYNSFAEYYTLYFKKDIQSTTGRKLSISEPRKFIVKENLPVIGSKEKLTAYFKEILKEQKKERGWFATSESMEEKSSMDSANGKEGSALKNDSDFSETNNQVQGVDEADVVKTDGKHIFQVEQNRIRIIKAVSNEMKLVSTISYDHHFNPNQLFLHENQLIVVGYQYHDFQRPVDEITKNSLKIAPMMQSTKAIIYNVERPEKPVMIREVELEGGFVSARKVNQFVYLVTQHYPELWIMEDNEKIDLRPKYSDSASGADKKTVSYNEITYFPQSKEPNYTMIAAIDLDQPSKDAAITTYLGSGNQLYMSKENLYLAITNWADQPWGDWTTRVAPDTHIHKFSVDGMKVEFQASALVQGTILNQFSMDEHNGYFRVVTTKGYAWDESRPSSNQLYILDRNLKQKGSLESLARGERIYSARFMGDRIYMVTFKETDPLFVIEASDPAKPKVLGELKIPGFSNYLHPYDENHLIGFGHDTKIVAEKEGPPLILTNGVKISMFDVSDMKNPKEKFTEIIGGRGTYSPLNHDHKALLFNKNKNLFAFPISVYQNSKKSEYEQIFEYQGAYVYNVDPENGFRLKSKITHLTGEQMPLYEEYEKGIQRLLYIGDTLYALSPEKITSHDLKTGKKTGELGLR